MKTGSDVWLNKLVQRIKTNLGNLETNLGNLETNLGNLETNLGNLATVEPKDCSNTDLNNLKTTGNYYGYTGMTNAAKQGISIIEVLKYSPDWLIQRQTVFDSYGGLTKYERHFHNGTTWTDWEPLERPYWENIQNRPDYIVEQGIADPIANVPGTVEATLKWSYRKWASGIVELWANYIEVNTRTVEPKNGCSISVPLPFNISVNERVIQVIGSNKYFICTVPSQSNKEKLEVRYENIDSEIHITTTRLQIYVRGTLQ